MTKPPNQTKDALADAETDASFAAYAAADAEQRLDALIEAIRLGPSECPCTTCVTRHAKRATYRKSDGYVERRKARIAGKRAAQADITLPSDEVMAEMGASLSDQIDAAFDGDVLAGDEETTAILTAVIEQLAVEPVKARATSPKQRVKTEPHPPVPTVVPVPR